MATRKKQETETEPTPESLDRSGSALPELADLAEPTETLPELLTEPESTPESSDSSALSELVELAEPTETLPELLEVVSEVLDQQPQGTYATEYFKKNGIPYCDRCGSQLHTDAEGQPVCAESIPDCPMTV
ncbi:hypothetical protein NIES2135_53320 [Leptolyngbya boryana NIES-2135]|uniref:Uncharacterized protein n=1 Tax=Leptolyngbya boryana NIES-2135 TaxID=1973484 RepID=A0A1Z4JP08_LEPBY|nr:MULTISPECIES: hypothetical protein [Leptolyngbya]BAY58459.1 hypothetical protein NIES2135_53320 [Leptolyngbya boryana NIES-2135]MBD2370932.1 hypothetical protein [Leptolyngbya sp. FACHB-161]MBD2377446.1 hypothetical protein [Leptolyngbya sp. FACHB-238]MBD2401854.1 hypothetical protein [Leptolyngbya sp. FACHB-239]MBD2408372.1 hypothetical protein [Leptolyngbya sp. FACHB-402]